MSERTLTTDDGVRLHTRVDGPSDAPPLLLCNSLGTDLTSWDPQLERWRSGRRVLRFDQRGHGASQAPPPPYGLDRLGRDALAVLDGCDAERADVCGISLGGLVALWLAATAPDRVRRLVLADTGLRIGTEHAWRQRAEVVRAGGMEAVTDLVLARFFSDTFRGSRDPALDRVARMLQQAPVDGYVGSCEALATADLTAAAADVRAPTLVIVGTADEATPLDDARRLHAALPDAELVELEGAGHLANLERPVAFADAVAAHLDRPPEDRLA